MSLRAVSAKRARQQRERRKVLAQMLDEHDGVCPRCFSARVVDGHELKTRAQGGSITDQNNIVLVCRRCHDWVHQHPTEAAEQGWLVMRKASRSS